MRTKESILDTIRKCLALSKSSNEHEAAAAAAKAQAQEEAAAAEAGPPGCRTGIEDVALAGVMILYHFTKTKYLFSILKKGLFPNKSGIIYLTPSPDKWSPAGEWCLIVDTGNLKLTSFEDCEEWEVLCWTKKPIPPSRLSIFELSNGST